MKLASQGSIKLITHFPTADIGDRVACWVVQTDEHYKPQVLLRQGFVIGLFGKKAVQIQDEELQGIEDPFYVGRDMLFEAGENPFPMAEEALVKKPKKSKGK